MKNLGVLLLAMAGMLISGCESGGPRYIYYNEASTFGALAVAKSTDPAVPAIWTFRFANSDDGLWGDTINSCKRIWKQQFGSELVGVMNCANPFIFTDSVRSSRCLAIAVSDCPYPCRTGAYWRVGGGRTSMQAIRRAIAHCENSMGQMVDLDDPRNAGMSGTCRVYTNAQGVHGAACVADQ